MRIIPLRKSQPAGENLSTAETYFHPIGLTPRQILSAYSAGQWEDFIEEWAASLHSAYLRVEHVSGAGDKGRDVVCHIPEPIAARSWDNYQCKHYDHPLYPGDAWLELGKLCYYTFIGDYTIPRRYRFVAPHDVGTTLNHYFSHPDELKIRLIKAWSEKCEHGISTGKAVKLDNGLKDYIEAFDFSIVGFTPLNEVVEQHRQTPHWHVRFKQALPPRPDAMEPPTNLETNEVTYVRKLLDAYGEAEGISVTRPEELGVLKPNYKEHLKRSRRAFFRAEQLNRFSRDIFPAGAFDKFKQQVFDGVVDTVESASHANGFARVVATTQTAAILTLGNCELKELAEVADKQGVCHHLANDNQITWVHT